MALEWLINHIFIIKNVLAFFLHLQKLLVSLTQRFFREGALLSKRLYIDRFSLGCGHGAMTFNIMTLSIKTLSIMVHSIMTLSVMSLSITTVSIMTFSITIRKWDTQHNNKKM
jgi:hypothetical protein